MFSHSLKVICWEEMLYYTSQGRGRVSKIVPKEYKVLIKSFYDHLSLCGEGSRG